MSERLTEDIFSDKEIAHLCQQMLSVRPHTTEELARMLNELRDCRISCELYEGVRAGRLLIDIVDNERDEVVFKTP